MFSYAVLSYVSLILIILFSNRKRFSTLDNDAKISILVIIFLCPLIPVVYMIINRDKYK